MFFGDPAAAHANIAGALRPGGRLALAVWQPISENEWFYSFTGALAAGRDLPNPPPNSPNPFSMSEPDKVHPLLAASGFEDIRFSEFGPDDLRGQGAQAHDFIIGQLGWLLTGLDDSSRNDALARLMHTMQEHETPAGVQFGSAMWLVSARRP